MPISTRRRHQAMCVDDHKPLFRQIGETNSETRFLLKLVNVDDEQKFPKTSVCIILVALVYLESAKIYTGPKTVRGLKRLRTTGISRHAAINTHKNKTMHWTTTFLNRTGWTILLTLNLTSVKVFMFATSTRSTVPPFVSTTTFISFKSTKQNIIYLLWQHRVVF